jgi:hypothetical protein
MRAYRGMEMNYGLHAPAALTPEKDYLVLTEYKVERQSKQGFTP